ncbi:hypothetical protein GCM10011428_57510 [Streptomyces violaceus]
MRDEEEVLAELLRGEAATAGPSAALTRYEAYRRELRNELGTDPGAGLKAVQRELLRGEAPAVRHGVPHEPNPLLGREEDIAAVGAAAARLPRRHRRRPGGLGKTRLAHAVSRRAEQRVGVLRTARRRHRGRGRGGGGGLRARRGRGAARCRHERP